MMRPRGLLQEAAVAAMSPLTTPALAADRADGASDSPSDLTPSTNIFYVNSHFSPTMIIILVILLSAFLFMALFAVYVRRCTGEEGSVSWRGGSRRVSRRDANGNIMGGTSGVDPSLVESYPIVSYAVAKKKGCYECPVCLGEFEGGDELRQLPKCKHLFHPGCIGLWLESHTTCPLCRRGLVNSGRWSVSFRWGGGSSRGSSASTRRNRQESSRSRRSGEIASSRFGRAGSSTGWLGARSMGDASSRGCAQHEMSVQIIEAGASCEYSSHSQGLPSSCLSSTSPHGLPASDRFSEVACPGGLPARSPASEMALRGGSESVLSNHLPQGTLQTSSFSSDLMPHEIQECCVSTDVMPREYQSSEVAARGQHASAVSSELAKDGGRKPRQVAALQGRRKLNRSNSTGHSVSRRAVMQATGCMPFALHRSRSVGVDGVDEEEKLVGPVCATSENCPVSGSGGSSQIPRQLCHDSTSAFGRL